jgi:cytochrome c-type biogenesis protein CcmE
MTPKRKQRLMLVSLMLLGAGAAVAFGLSAFKQNIMLFHSPTDIAAGTIEPDIRFRIGGMVVDGSVQRGADDLKVRFELTDTAESVAVEYSGILPDLFSEGQGIVAMGKLDATGVFVASEVLAKHDENYMPPEVADALEKAGAMPGTAANWGATTVAEP